MGFGSDFSAFTDLDANLTFLEGDEQEAVALTQAVARRFITPRGGDPWDPAYGLDLRSFLSDSYNADEVALMISAEARKDERVQDCAVEIEVTEVDGDEAWEIDVNCTASTGAVFAFTLSVSQVSVTLLKTGNA